MKTRLLWFVGLGFLLSVVTVIAATAVIRKPGNDKSLVAVATAAMQKSLESVTAPAGTSHSGLNGSMDAAAAKVIAEKQALQSLYTEFRAAKMAGHAPSADLYRRLHEMMPNRQNRGTQHLDQGGETCASATVIPSISYSDFGTTTGYLDDYNPDCPYAGASGNSPDVVYSYMPTSNMTCHVSLCGSSYDTRLFVYAGTCSGTPIACNDDGTDCWPSSDIPSISLTAGVTYYFVVDGYGDGSFGDYAFLVEEIAPPPTGDVCADPILIPSLPYSVSNASTCTFNNDYSATCLPFAEGPDVVYSFTLASPTSVEIIANAHVGTPPNETLVMSGVLLSDHCPPDYSCIASTYQISVDGFTPMYLACQTLAAGTYYVVLDNGNWGQTCFNYDLTVQTCGPCDITSQGGDVEEVAETFPVPGTYSINDPDGGCNNTTPQYQNILSGQTIHGRTFSYTDSISGSLISDTDWYRFVLASPAILSGTYQSESWLRVGLLQGPCPATVVLNLVQSTPCATVSYTSGCLDPGEYFVRISRGGSQLNDGILSDYRAFFTLTPCVLPTGRCCYAGTCANNTHPECVALDGYWDGNLTCDSPCPVYPPNDRCENAGIPATLPATFTGNNTNATNDCPLEGDPQVWHVFTTTETQCIQIDFCGTENFHSFNPWLYPSCPCAAGVYLDAVDWGFCSPIQTFAGIWRNLPAGTWYLPVTMYNPNSIGAYTIHVNAISCLPPENDECTTATPITLIPNGSVNVNGTTMNATASCTNICNENGSDYYSTGGDVFYSLTLTECRRLALALGTGDMHIAVYQGLANCCTDPAFLCNDDDAYFTNLPWWDVPAQHPGNSASYVAADFEPGVYLIRVAKYGAQVGHYELTVYDNGSCHCTPPVANDVSIYREDNNVNIRWSTDAANAALGTYRIYSNTAMLPITDPSWTVVADNITPVIGTHHLYYSAPWAGSDRLFYYVTGICTDAPPPQPAGKTER